MTFILVVAILVVGSMLLDMRTRLSVLEREVADLWRAEGSSPSRGSTAPPPDNRSIKAATIVQRHPPTDPVEEVVPATAPMRADAGPSEPAIESPLPPASMEEQPAEPAFITPNDHEATVAAAPHLAPDEPEEAVAGTSRATGFEDLFGRRLPIWAGGVTLLVAAVLLVKYSIDAGMLSPWVRVTLGFLFGTALIASAEISRRMERFVQDDRVAQSLAGAGVGALFAVILAASNLYGLIGPSVAFAGLTATTLLAMGLALRFGAPCAVLALVGGLATPALVQSSAPNIPLLSGYLAMVIGSLTLLSRRQRWFWLGAMALAGGLGWTAIIITMSALGQLSLLSVGLLVMLLGLALPFLSSDNARGATVQMAGAAAAALQIALLVSIGGYGALSWGLYGLLSLAFLWLSGRVPMLRPFMTLPLGTGVLLMALWPNPTVALFAAVMAGHLAIFGLGALWRLWRPGGTIGDAARIALVAIAGFAVTVWQFDVKGDIGHDMLAWLGVAFALVPAAGVALGWRDDARHADMRFPLLALATGFLLMLAGLIGLPDWTAPLVMAGVAMLMLLMAELAQDRRISTGGLAYLAGALPVLVITGFSDAEFERLVKTALLDHPVQTWLRWSGLTLAWGLYAWRHARALNGPIITAITAALGYGLMAQFIPAPWLAIAAALAMLALSALARQYASRRLDPALGVLIGIAVLWMLEPLARWLLGASLSVAGVPLWVTSLPSADLALRQLLAPAALIGGGAWLMRARLGELPRWAVPAAVGTPLLIGLHCLYKLVFAIDSQGRFISLGLAERTIWEIALIAAGLGLWRWLRQREAALALLGLGLAHNLFYSLMLHNPLWNEQAVGSWPIVNLLLPAFAIAFAGPSLMALVRPGLKTALAWTADTFHMIVLLLFAYASLRQLFCGSVFAHAAVGQVESIFWSVLAIAMAIGWLLWGIRRAAHSWRIGSLALMLAAVAKVFLIDASGLEGLLRVASFLALGFSLIGIGWLYSRFLRRDPN